MYENLINDLVNSISESKKPKIISNVKISFSLFRLMQSRGILKRFKQNHVKQEPIGSHSCFHSTS